MQGTPLMDLWLASSMDEPAPLNLAYNELKYDYLNIGNHDFNYGLKAQKRFFELMDAQTSAPILKVFLIKSMLLRN